MTHVSLFSGVGGIDLAAEWAGFETVLQVEIDPYCRRVLEKHWPDVKRIEDIRDVNKNSVNEPVTLVSGGFPCQDISIANQISRDGIDGKRSGLWKEMFRVVCEIQPKYMLVENVPALLSRGLNRILGNLAEIGYDAEWDCLSAWQVGAPHARQRTFVVAYPASERLETNTIFAGTDLACSYPSHSQWKAVKHDEQRLFDQVFGYRLPPYPSDLRMDNGLAPWMDRLRCLGNAVVPAQVLPILRAIAEIEEG
ncbi:hypothetical protein LCGC14_2596140 [marine sediment metagenome]|uniref:DNA (cytosine-5-)-methyltransferase n=1 Tax=marine sediment metagenome TaxID=412755 RepID=A0A0F9CL59_9ZZZZ